MEKEIQVKSDGERQMRWRLLVMWKIGGKSELGKEIWGKRDGKREREK
jgi:hypothetical protein